MSTQSNSHNIIFQEVKERLKDQFDSIDSLDTKAGVTLGFVGALLAGLVNSNWFLNLPYYFLLFILLPLASTIIFLLKVVFVRTYRKDPDPKMLIEGYKDKKEDETIRQLIRNFEDCFTKNQKSLDDKKKYLNWGFKLIAATVLIVCLIVFITTQFTATNIYGKNQVKEWRVNKYGRYR